MRKTTVGVVSGTFAYPEPADTLDAIQVAPPHMQSGAATRPRKTRTVVHVERANKFYGAKHVLKELSMAVEEHTIYGLLGASGCGKTTILSCIVALRKLDSGSILVCGHPTGDPRSGVPGKRVGYMPQETAMNGEFTVEEVLAYFGRIYGMSPKDIRKRANYLQTLLDLNGLVCQIDALSDGQKRRVSLAVSLIHQPDLLILDEPTVGLDPLLRDCIWVYLKDLVSKSSTTIIVTTHYIEEMRQADRVGIMRSGHLLCEDSPTNLLQIYQEDLLDTVVVKLCKQDEGPSAGEVIRPAACSSNGNANAVIRTREVKSAVDVQLEWRRGVGGDEIHASSLTNRLHGLLMKDALVMIRNWVFSFLVILIPAIIVLIFNLVLNSDPTNLKVGVVNYETESCPAKGGPHGFNGSVGCAGGLAHLGCAYIHALGRKEIKLVWFNTVEDAEEEALKGKLWGYFWLEETFSQDLHSRLVLGQRDDNGTMEGSRVNVRLDITEMETMLFLRSSFLDAFEKLRKALFTSCGISGGDAALEEAPIQFGDTIFNFPSEDAHKVGYLSGVSLGYIFFFGALQCGLTYIREKGDGMLARTMVAGVRTIEIVVSHFVIHFVAIVQAQLAACFLLIFVIFGASYQGSLLLAFALIVFNAVAGMSFGFLLATFCSNEKHAMVTAMGLILPTFILTGIWFPLEDMPPAMQWVGKALPCTIAGEALRSILCRGMGLAAQLVWLGFVTAIGYTCVCWALIFAWHWFGLRKG